MYAARSRPRVREWRLRPLTVRSDHAAKKSRAVRNVGEKHGAEELCDKLTDPSRCPLNVPLQNVPDSLREQYYLAGLDVV